MDRPAPRTACALRAAALAAALAAGLNGGTALAAPVAVDLGGVRVVLDAPAGFSDTTFTGSPRLRDLAESLVPASNRVLLFALTDADLRAFSVGDTPELRRMLVAATPRHLEREWVGTTQLNQQAAELIGTATSRPSSGYLSALKTQPFGQPLPLTELFRDRNGVAVVQGTRFPGPDGNAEKQTYALSGTVLLMLRGKLVSLLLFTRYASDADAEWIQTATRRWAEDLRRLNTR